MVFNYEQTSSNNKIYDGGLAYNADGDMVAAVVLSDMAH